MRTAATKGFNLTSFHRDILRAILSQDGHFCNAETVRRTMFGKDYPGWEMDALRINQAMHTLWEFGFLRKRFTSCSVTDAGLGAIICGGAVP